MGSKSNLEIERKFLVDQTKWSPSVEGPFTLVQQAYLSFDPKKTVRVRRVTAFENSMIVSWKGFITVKGVTTGCSRPEYEYEIPEKDAFDLIEMVEGPVITKRRHIHYVMNSDSKSNATVWEVDTFLERLDGLVVAEVELDNENDLFHRPDFLLQEVTHDPRYSNSSLNRALAEGLPLPPFS